MCRHAAYKSCSTFQSVTQSPAAPGCDVCEMYWRQQRAQQTPCWRQQTWCHARSSAVPRSITVIYRWDGGKKKKKEKKEENVAAVCARPCPCVCVCVCASSQTRCLVTQCVRPGPSEIIKYPFAVKCAVDATVSIATGSAELHNIRLCLPGALLWLLPRLPSSIIMPQTLAMDAQHTGWERQQGNLLDKYNQREQDSRD